MRAVMKAITATVLVACLGTAVHAGVIERACVKSDRKAANRAICGCIQDVADITLDANDQKLAARFFRNPQLAQDIRESDRGRDERFWERYKSFGQTAETYCG